jgi:hypothetical protein
MASPSVLWVVRCEPSGVPTNLPKWRKSTPSSKSVKVKREKGKTEGKNTLSRRTKNDWNKKNEGLGIDRLARLAL